MIRVILWDVDGTLLDFLAAERQAMTDCFLHFGLGECAPEQIARYSAINKRHWEMLERGEITRDQVKVLRFARLFEAEGVAADA